MDFDEVLFKVKNKDVYILKNSPLYVVWEENKKETGGEKEKEEKNIFEIAYESKLITKEEKQSVYDLLEKGIQEEKRYKLNDKEKKEDEKIGKILNLHKKCNIPYVVEKYIFYIMYKDEKDFEGRTSCQKWIIKNRDIKLLDYLVQKGEKREKKFRASHTILYTLTETTSSDIKFLKLILKKYKDYIEPYVNYYERGTYVNYEGCSDFLHTWLDLFHEYNNFILHIIKLQDLELTKLVLDLFPNINTFWATYDESIPFWDAVTYNNKEIAMLMAEQTWKNYHSKDSQ